MFTVFKFVVNLTLIDHNSITEAIKTNIAFEFKRTI